MIKIKPLLEKNRLELINKTRRESPQRVNKSSSYSISNIFIDPDAFLNNWLVIKCTINGNNGSYNDDLAFKNIINDLIDEAKNSSSHIVNSKLIQKVLKSSFDKNDVYVNCTCPDFQYTFAYFATKDNFKWGKLQNSNGKKIRNPNNDKGAMCKHLYALLRSNNFFNKVSDKCMRTIIANLDVLVKKYNINLKEFVVNTAYYDRLLQMNLTRDDKGRFKKQEDDNNANETSKDSKNKDKEEMDNE